MNKLRVVVNPWDPSTQEVRQVTLQASLGYLRLCRRRREKEEEERKRRERENVHVNEPWE